MNSLSNLSKIVENKKKRVGRGAGSGRGAKSGRGTTRHQAARENIPLYFEGGQGRMVKRFPLLRGKGKLKSVRPKPLIMKLSDLNAYKNDEIVTIESLINKKIVDARAKKVGIKIVNSPKFERQIIVRKLKISNSAKKKIEDLGGKVEL